MVVLFVCYSVGSESSTLETDVYVLRYALLMVLARKEDESSFAIWSMSCTAAVGCHTVCVVHYCPSVTETSWCFV